MKRLALCGLAACTSPPPQVCDGSADLRLAVRYDAPGPFAAGERLLYDNGTSFLFVDGGCRYAVKTGAIWGDVAFGSFASDADLVDDLELADLPARAGRYDGDTATANTLHLAFEGATLDCTQGCTGAPDWLTHLAAHAAATLTAAWKGGAIQRDPERVVVLARAVPPTPSYLWPASFDPSTIAGASTRVEDADGYALQALRREVAQHPTAAAYVTTDAAAPPSYAVYLRDALPWEGADGVVANP